MIKKPLRFLGFLLIGIVGLLLVFVVVSVVPLDRSVDRDQLQEEMMARIDLIEHSEVKSDGFSIGFAKENLTPPHRTATAGYGNRRNKLYESVHDSIYVRTMVIDNGIQRIAIVSADLLIIPPTVTALLETELPEIGFSLDNTYLGAIHSHNSIGNWGQGATTFIYGSYDESVVRFIVDKIKESITKASQNLLPSILKAGAIPLDHIVQNRLIDDGPVDSLLRVIEVHRNDSSKLLLMSFTAHATCLSSRDLQLSRDYPGELVDSMEEEGYVFAMFMAGSVGSHRGTAPERGRSCTEWMAKEITNGFITNRNLLEEVSDSTVAMYRVPLLLSDPQVKVLEDWSIRPWLFSWAFGDYPEYLTVLRLGNLVMLGTPCDFSGEFNRSLDEFAECHGLSAMVTSFNGGYIGYVTPDKYYDIDHYETQLMNWYGQGNGEYINQCMKRLILAVKN